MVLSDDSKEQREVRMRVRRYLPAWCATKKYPVDPSAFDLDWSFLTQGVALWFLRAIDEDVVEIRDGWPTLKDSRQTHISEQNKGKGKLTREGFLEVAAAGMLARRYEWPRESLTFQPPPAGPGSLPRPFDLLAYAGRDQKKVAIAGEAKWRQKDAESLARGLNACGERGNHAEGEGCRVNDHRKHVGLLEHQPRILWIFGPDAFTEGPDLVFRVEETTGGIVHLRPVEAAQLAASAFS